MLWPVMKPHTDYIRSDDLSCCFSCAGSESCVVVVDYLSEPIRVIQGSLAFGHSHYEESGAHAVSWKEGVK